MARKKHHKTSSKVSEHEERKCSADISNNSKFKTGNYISFIPSKPSKTSKSSNERGATMLEYGVMVALIAVASITVVRSLGEKINDDAFVKVDAHLAQACFPNCN